MQFVEASATAGDFIELKCVYRITHTAQLLKDTFYPEVSLEDEFRLYLWCPRLDHLYCIT